jgi:hypothetical protein
MKTQQKKLAKLEEEIIDALANDYESLDQLRDMLSRPIPDNELKEALWTLTQEGYISCHRPTKTEMKSVIHPDRQHLSDYWYALTDTGEGLLGTIEAH